MRDVTKCPNVSFLALPLIPLKLGLQEAQVILRGKKVFSQNFFELNKVRYFTVFY